MERGPSEQSRHTQDTGQDRLVRLKDVVSLVTDTWFTVKSDKSVLLRKLPQLPYVDGQPRQQIDSSVQIPKPIDPNNVVTLDELEEVLGINHSKLPRSLRDGASRRRIDLEAVRQLVRDRGRLLASNSDSQDRTQGRTFEVNKKVTVNYSGSVIRHMIDDVCEVLTGRPFALLSTDVQQALHRRLRLGQVKVDLP